MPTAFEILGVPCDASVADIKKAFRQQAKIWHPDKRPQGESKEESLQARKHFLAVHNAYEEALRQQGSSDGQCSSDGAQSKWEDAFDGYDEEALAEAVAAREGAEAYVKELREQTMQDIEWTEDEEEELFAIWKRAFMAVNILREKEAHVKVFMEFGKAVKAPRTKPSREAQAAEEAEAAAGIETPPLQVADQPEEAAGQLQRQPEAVAKARAARAEAFMFIDKSLKASDIMGYSDFLDEVHKGDVEMVRADDDPLLFLFRFGTRGLTELIEDVLDSPFAIARWCSSQWE
eukprot:TRINITY_DN6271_c0_g1_i4.p1 TRINITY_DN6271_c0_g1~~TRINITY_DN6271_c0_g1_i4.p1  ORF type:complete len:290 (+),score=97.77 TRINITY_DN6271_c0_g1_i4:53-922(+)